MNQTENTIIIGIRSHVVALDPSTGDERWRTKLKSGQFVTTYVRGERVYAGVSGELFCVGAADGEIVWHNKLKRLGFGLVAFAADPPRRKPHNLIVGIKGHVVAIDVTSGHEIWRAKLPAGIIGTHVTLAVHDADTILAGTGGELFAVHRAVGKVLWQAKLKRLGVGLVSLGSHETAIAAAIAQAQAAGGAAAAG